MEGVTTALVGFVLAGLIWNQIIKNKLWYYIAVLCVLMIILFSGLSAVIQVEAFSRAAIVIVMLMQMAGIVLLFLAAGGFSIKTLMSDVSATVAPPSEESTTATPPAGESAKSGDTQTAPPSDQSAQPPSNPQG